jgi:hypothetical protein
MVNTVRGEVELLVDGKSFCLCLTLGALAEIEAAFDLSSSADLSERLQKISAEDVVTLLEALLAGGGNPLSADQIRQTKLDPGQVAMAIASAFSQQGNAP